MEAVGGGVYNGIFRFIRGKTMLSKSDKEWIKNTFDEQIVKALTVKVNVVQKRDPKTGVPLKTEKHFTEDVFLPHHWVEFLPFYEQAIVAMEEVTEQARNRSKSGLDQLKELQTKVDAIGQLYITLEKPLKALAAFSDVIQDNRKLTMNEHLDLVYESNPG